MQLVPFAHDLHQQKRLQLHLLLSKQRIPINILDRIRPHILERLFKLVRLLGAISEEMILYQFLRRLAEPLEQRKVLELVGAENLEHLDVLFIAQILDEVAHVAGNNADVAGLKVKCACSAFAGENCDAGATFDEVGPFIGVRYMMLDSG
jgi:hypothetical protein